MRLIILSANSEQSSEKKTHKSTESLLSNIDQMPQIDQAYVSGSQDQEHMSLAHKGQSKGALQFPLGKSGVVEHQSLPKHFEQVQHRDSRPERDFKPTYDSSQLPIHSQRYGNIYGTPPQSGTVTSAPSYPSSDYWPPLRNHQRRFSETGRRENPEMLEPFSSIFSTSCPGNVAVGHDTSDSSRNVPARKSRSSRKDSYKKIMKKERKGSLTGANTTEVGKKNPREHNSTAKSSEPIHKEQEAGNGNPRSMRTSSTGCYAPKTISVNQGTQTENQVSRPSPLRTAHQASDTKAVNTDASEKVSRDQKPRQKTMTKGPEDRLIKNMLQYLEAPQSSPKHRPRHHQNGQSKTQAGYSPKRIYLENLAIDTTETELGDFFAGYQLESTSLMISPTSKQSSVIASVDLASPAEAERAIAELSSRMLRHRKIVLQIASEPKSATTERKTRKRKYSDFENSAQLQDAEAYESLLLTDSRSADGRYVPEAMDRGETPESGVGDQEPKRAGYFNDFSDENSEVWDSDSEDAREEGECSESPESDAFSCDNYIAQSAGYE
ncbi:MAG: hypothetical protein M1837_005610 [Sclerophora amabilis]|nr:MAG: hypothetical protein M1837_005610 [Sclerophora amabilis]